MLHVVHFGAAAVVLLDEPAELAPIAFERAEYALLADEFAFLAEQFGVAVPFPLRRDIARLASAIERIDRRVDEALTDDVERRARWRAVVEVLKSGGGRRGAPPELIDASMELRQLAIEQGHGTLDRVRRIVEDESHTSEAIREATTMRAFIRAVEREGRHTASLALLIAGKRANDPLFRRFFFRLAAPANLVDKILDARDDYACGEIAIDPDARFYAALIARLLYRSVLLVGTSPRPQLMLRLAQRYLITPLLAR